MAHLSGFHDHFSGHAAEYRKYRPDYPPALFAFLASLASTRELAWDCGTGNGQAAVALAPHFVKVIASDASVKQVAEAEPRPNIEYFAAPAEQAPLEDASADLVNVSQALHWFEHPRFFAEVRRVCKPGGVFSATAYDVHRVNEAVDPILDRFQSHFVGPFWPPERRHVDAGYRTIPIPFVRIETPRFELTQSWNLQELLGYMSTWSATKQFMKAKGFDPLEAMAKDFEQAWGNPSEAKAVRWILHLFAGRVKA